MKHMKKIIFLFFGLFCLSNGFACSVLYYIDESTGKIYVANNEDYWYSTEAYIQIVPKSKKAYARLWYGWDNFAQGGVNEHGLFFDGAVTPDQPMPEGHKSALKNAGDKVLAYCKDVREALNYLEKNKTAYHNAHLMFGDKTGNAVVIEWVKGERKVIHIKENHLTMTNFLLAEPLAGNFPCRRYHSIEENIKKLQKETSLGFPQVGNLISNAVQLPTKDKDGKTGGTLYSSFINLTDMEMMLIYKLNNKKLIKLNLKNEFNRTKKHKIELEKLGV